MNLLDDLENFIDSDWKEVYEEFKTEERKESISEPVIPDFPSYKEFYEIMVKLMHDPNTPPFLEYFIHRFVRTRDREVKGAKAFEKVWSLFCNPREYDIYTETCNECRRNYSIIVHREPPEILFGRFGETQEMRMRSERVHCSHCGVALLVVAGTVIGLFENSRMI